MSLSRFEYMLKTNNVYFFDSVEFEDIIHHYLDNGKHSLAKKATELGLQQHPASVVLRLLKVELLIFDGKMQRAINILSELEAVEPNNEEVLIQKSIIYSKHKKHKKAIISLKKALSYIEEPAEIWSMIGMEYLYLDDFKNAQLNFINCIDADSGDYSSFYNLMYCFDMEDNHKEAIIFLNNYLDKNPYSEIAWHQLGKQYFTLNMFKEALVSFDYSVLIDGAFVGGYIEKAKALEELKRYKEAIENYLITFELDDPTAFVYLRIGRCYERLRVFDTAISYYKKAVNEDPLSEKGWFLLANLYQQKEEYQKALYYIGKTLNIDQCNSLYWRKYAEINSKLDFYEEVVKAFHKCIELNDVSIEIYIALSDVLLFLGDFEDALEIMIKARNKYENFAEIEYRLCGLFMLAHKEKYSLIHLKNGLTINFEHIRVIEELYPTVFDNSKVQNIIACHLKIMN